MKKGFTLVELLATIALIGLLALLTIPAVDSILDKQKQRIYEQNKNTIKDALKLWGNENISSLPENGEEKEITLGELKKQGLLDLNFKNPKTKRCYSNDNIFIIKNTYNVYTYKVDDLIDGEDEDCTGWQTRLKPGLYDENDVMLASWNELVNDYGMDIEWGKNVNGGSGSGGYMTPNISSLNQTYRPSNIFSNNEQLRNGVKLVIPKTIKKIPTLAFYECNLTDIVIPSSVTTIGEYSFASNKIKELVIPEGVVTIEPVAFQDNEIEKVVLSNTVITIGNSAFHTNHLTSVGLVGSDADIELSNNITTIGNYAFSKNQITNVELPNGITEISNGLFFENNLTNIIIPDQITRIGEFAFGDNSLTNIVIPNSVTSIGGYAFRSNKLTSVIIPNSVTSIENYAFYNNQLTSVTIGNSVTTIGDLAFSGNQLTSVIIPDSVTSIGQNAFHTNHLTSVTIGNSVTNIGGYAFVNNYNLTSVTFSNPTGWTICSGSGTNNTNGVYSCKSGVAVENVDLSNPSTNVTYLSSTYYNKAWIRN